MNVKLLKNLAFRLVIVFGFPFFLLCRKLFPDGTIPYNMEFS